MKKALSIALVFTFALGWLFIGSPLSPAQANSAPILQFNNMVGIPQDLTGTQHPIRDINGGGLPWTLTSANGVLTSTGRLVLNVNGLVFAAGTNEGSNTIPEFGVIVSCLSSDGSVVNLSAGLFSATTGSALTGGGDAHIQTNVDLPQTCIAPIIFVTSPTGVWFAATGK
jgi:hypothetical protein